MLSVVPEQPPAGPRTQIVGTGWIWEDWGTDVRIRLTQLDLELSAAPQPDAHYAATAQALGYGSDILRMNRLHDLMHLALIEWLTAGRRLSPVLTAVARGHPEQLDTWQLEGEEGLVLSFARFLETGVPGPELYLFPLLGIDLQQLRSRWHQWLQALEKQGTSGALLPLESSQPEEEQG